MTGVGVGDGGVDYPIACSMEDIMAVHVLAARRPAISCSVDLLSSRRVRRRPRIVADASSESVPSVTIARLPNVAAASVYARIAYATACWYAARLAALGAPLE
jgi:hypothetical protein